MTPTQNKVLLIDDEIDVVSFFKMTFEDDANIQLLSAVRGKEGIEIARRERPKVVVIDLRMPDIDGEEVLKTLKSELVDAKFVVMTGWDDGETRDRILETIGVDAYFDKPADLEKMIAKIVELAAAE